MFRRRNPVPAFPAFFLASVTGSLIIIRGVLALLVNPLICTSELPFVLPFDKEHIEASPYSQRYYSLDGPRGF